MGPDRKAVLAVSATGHATANLTNKHGTGRVGINRLIRCPRTDLWALKSLVSFESRCEFGVSGDRYLYNFAYSPHRASGRLVSTMYDLQGVKP